MKNKKILCIKDYIKDQTREFALVDAGIMYWGGTKIKFTLCISNNAIGAHSPYSICADVLENIIRFSVDELGCPEKEEYGLYVFNQKTSYARAFDYMPQAENKGEKKCQ